MQKTITVVYAADPGTSQLTGCAISNDFNVTGVVTQADNLTQLKDRAPKAIDLMLDGRHSERSATINIVYKKVTPTELMNTP